MISFATSSISSSLDDDYFDSFLKIYSLEQIHPFENDLESSREGFLRFTLRLSEAFMELVRERYLINCCESSLLIKFGDSTS